MEYLAYSPKTLGVQLKRIRKKGGNAKTDRKCSIDRTIDGV